MGSCLQFSLDVVGQWRVQGGALGAEAPRTRGPQKKKEEKKKREGKKDRTEEREGNKESRW